ncbi:calcium-binding protein P-like [Penaeus japonicus]|uniref:calcium-binding protein P-like n=1 Tax=Penaeus japonicus TaxID=27405 RepID=UPI001C70C7DE|nr:calcium-binding protein P-like [Penaeus japonicus]
MRVFVPSAPGLCVAVLNIEVAVTKWTATASNSKISICDLENVSLWDSGASWLSFNGRSNHKEGLSLLRVLVVAACVLASTAQLTFPGESEGSSSPRDSTPSASPAADAPAGPQGQTRFLPGLLNLFDPCQRCSPSDQVEAGRCCQSGHRRCCAFLQAPGGFGPGPIPPPFGGFPGQAGGFPGQVGGFPGQVGGFPGQAGGFPGQAGGFPGQPGGPIVGPPGFGGGRPGTCPFVNNVHSGFNRFAQTTSCVAECQSDFQCPTPQKCCAVGCSSVCRNPAGCRCHAL